MRRALNENPIVQVVMLGILGVIVAVLFMTRVMGGQDQGAEGAATSPTAAADVAPGAPPATDAAAPVTAPAEPGAAPGSTVPVAPDNAGFEAGAGLPKAVVTAYDSGDVVVLLVVDRKAVEDRRVEAEVNRLRGRGDVAVFVAESKNVASYSRIAEGVNLDRVPALVVLEPKRQVQGELPAATISYGYRGPESVNQAVQDILYDGKELPYHPG
jgi:hypothetical protein